MEEKKDKKPAPVCKCGKQSKHHVYSTFEFFYCQDCKAEVKEEEKPKRHRSWTATEALAQLNTGGSTLLGGAQMIMGGAASQPRSPYSSPYSQLTPQHLAKIYPPRPVPAALPPGIVALKGEKIVCESCGAVCAELKADLPNKHLSRAAQWGSAGQYLGCACPIVRCVRNDFGYGSDEFYVEGRGWV